jgi:ferredoxin
LDCFLERLRALGTVYVPAMDETGEVVFAEVSRAPTVLLAYPNVHQSPKAFFFPQNQTLLHLLDGREKEPSPSSEGTVFLFGVRPCDARALLALDDVFLSGDLCDPYYADLRARTVVIALACTRPLSTCFCTSVGGGPGDGAGADVLAVGLQADLLLSARTPRGEELLSSVADLLTDASPAALAQAEKLLQETKGQMATSPVENSAERLRDAWGSPVWEAVGRKCLGCGTCSFLCPTCHCFDVSDEVRGGRGRRVRTWDSCAYPLFTLHASGHNPRPTATERWRQRLMHKFRYAVENYDRLFCVGCGRCVRHCPAGIDLRTVLAQVGA